MLRSAVISTREDRTFDQPLPVIYFTLDTLVLNRTTMLISSPLLAIVLLALAACRAEGAIIDWTANPEETVLLPQCEDLTFSLTGTHNIKNLNKKGRFKRCDFSRSTTLLDVTRNEEFTFGGHNFLKRKKYFYGCDVVSLGACIYLVLFCCRKMYGLSFRS